MMDTFLALGYNAFDHGNEHRFIATLPIVRHDGHMYMPTSPGWTTDDIKLVDEYEFDDMGVSLPREIPIDEGMILAVMGPRFYRAMQYLLFVPPLVDAYDVETQNGFKVSSMNIKSFFELRRSLGEIALNCFDDELQDHGAVTDDLNAHLMVLMNSHAVLLDDRLVRSLIVQKLNGSEQEYRDALALSAQRLNMTQDELASKVTALLDGEV
jgi:hypothetical protein